MHASLSTPGARGVFACQRGRGAASGRALTYVPRVRRGEKDIEKGRRDGEKKREREKERGKKFRVEQSRDAVSEVKRETRAIR